MDFDTELLQATKELGRAKLSSEEDDRIRGYLNDLLREEVSRKSWRRPWFWAAAASGAVGLVTAGTFLVHSHIYPSSPSSPPSAKQPTSLAQPFISLPTDNTAREVIKGNWRLVFTKALLKPGDYYNLDLYYTGKSFSMSGYTVNWGGARVGDGGAQVPNENQVNPGEFTGFSSVSAPHGVAKLPVLKLSWTGGGTWAHTGSKHSLTFNPAAAVADLHVENFHQYVGQDKYWQVAYAYETISGNGVQLQKGVMLLHHVGPSKFGGSLWYTLTSKTTHGQFSYQNVSGPTIRTPIDAGRKENQITGSKATITLHWQGKTDTITLKRQK